MKCGFAERCTRNKAGRLIERSEFATYYEANAKRIHAREHQYKRRQAIVEHGYGILKRQWGYYFISTKKTIEHAAADVGLMFTALNLRRIFNILPQNLLQAYLKGLVRFFMSLFALLSCYSSDLPKAIFNNSSNVLSIKLRLQTN